MKGSDRQWLARACHRLLRPLVRTLLSHGVAHKDFDAVVRSVYAEVARESFTPRGKRPTDSHVAIVTGLTRKEIKRLREQADRSYDQTNWSGANRATRVLSGWHRDPDFTGADGAPRRLHLDADNNEFAQLVRRYSGDIPTVAILDELERVHAVKRECDGTVRVLNRAYVPEAGDPERIRMLGTAGHDLLATLEHNLSRAGDVQPRFQRSVFNLQVDPRALPVFHRLVAQQSQHMLEVFDDWLERHETHEHSPDQPGARAGVGIYFFQDTEHPGDMPDDP